MIEENSKKYFPLFSTYSAFFSDQAGTCSFLSLSQCLCIAIALIKASLKEFPIPLFLQVTTPLSEITLSPDFCPAHFISGRSEALSSSSALPDCSNSFAMLKSFINEMYRISLHFHSFYTFFSSWNIYSVIHYRRCCKIIFVNHQFLSG